MPFDLFGYIETHQVLEGGDHQRGGGPEASSRWLNHLEHADGRCFEVRDQNTNKSPNRNMRARLKSSKQIRRISKIRKNQRVNRSRIQGTLPIGYTQRRKWNIDDLRINWLISHFQERIGRILVLI